MLANPAPATVDTGHVGLSAFVRDRRRQGAVVCAFKLHGILGERCATSGPGCRARGGSRTGSPGSMWRWTGAYAAAAVCAAASFGKVSEGER